MIIYPIRTTPYDGLLDGFTAEEIKQGIHWLYTDVECTVCKKAQTLANAGSTDNGKCMYCGERTN